MMRFAEVSVDVPLSSNDQLFDYSIPHTLFDRVAVGSRVSVPFGARIVEGYILRIKKESAISHVKEIYDVLDETPPLNDELISVAKFISDRYLASLFLSLQVMVPSALRTKYVKVVEWNEERDDFPLIVLPEEEGILEYIRSKSVLEYKLLLKKFPQAASVVEHYVKKNYLIERMKLSDHSDVKLQKVVQLQISESEAKVLLASLAMNANKQKAVIELLLVNGALPLKELMVQTKSGYSTIRRLEEIKAIVIKEEAVQRHPYHSVSFKPDRARKLTSEQQMVYEQIVSPITDDRHQVFLLHGVTGSGKTEVYLQSIEFTLGKQKSAIVLVPEISLTPMMVARFKSRFGEKVAVLHSALSAGERLDEWRRIRNGEATVVVGARSAIFAPVAQLGMIIIDEEHESTYKQEEQPRYHSRDVAIYRAQQTNSVVVLGSATPSLEAYAYALAARFQLLEMKRRVNERNLPLIHLVDMRHELHDGHRHMFSRVLLQKIAERLQKKEQIVLLLNRRGHSTFVICRGCGYTAECPHCDITLTYHQTNHTMRCHYCNYTEAMPHQCPTCASTHIRYFGTGTQRVEEELFNQFPEIRVIRMDMDTTSNKGAHERLLTSFGNFEADVLLGTQMIAKGLDFPKVSLVGMINADTMLHLPDFRSSERTFQLITQVAGRAGRHDIPGEVVVQTYTPDHYSIQLSVKQNYLDFFLHEAKLRRLGKYPPFYRICMVHFSHEQTPVLVKALNRFVAELHTVFKDRVVLYGPVPATIPKVKDRYRYHCMLKYKNEPKLNQILMRAISNIDDLVQKHGIQINIDIDPQYLM